MAKGINKVILIGNAGSDPQSKVFSSGDKITSVSIGTTDSWRDKATGDNKKSTEWHKVSFRGKLAELSEQYIRKGSKVYVEGSLKTRSWEKNGDKHYMTEVIAHEFQLLNNRAAAVSDRVDVASNNQSDFEFDDDIPF